MQQSVLIFFEISTFISEVVFIILLHYFALFRNNAKNLVKEFTWLDIFWEDKPDCLARYGLILYILFFYFMQCFFTFKSCFLYNILDDLSSREFLKKGVRKTCLLVIRQLVKTSVVQIVLSSKDQCRQSINEIGLI